MALQIFVLPGARRAYRNRPVGGGRARSSIYQDLAACTMARVLASGAVAGMAQPAFRMKRRVSPNRAMSSRDLASTSARVPSATMGRGRGSRGLNEAIFAVDVGESHRSFLAVRLAGRNEFLVGLVPVHLLEGVFDGFEKVRTIQRLEGHVLIAHIELHFLD